jgi:hypothetical protein
MITLALNKWDHLRYRIAIRQFAPVDCLMDIGSRDHPQTLVKVTERFYTVDPEKSPDIPDPKHLHIEGTWADVMSWLRNYHVHTVTLIDVIEYLEKGEGLRLLKETERLVDQIIVFTPLGFMEQDDGEWNSHRSGWMPYDFGFGWKVQVFPYFHWCDFKGKVLDKPHGAILAVYKKEKVDSFVV